jgi:hypothetical protein
MLKKKALQRDSVLENRQCFNVNGMSFVTKYFDRNARANLLTRIACLGEGRSVEQHIGRKRNIYWKPSLLSFQFLEAPRSEFPALPAHNQIVAVTTSGEKNLCE